MCAPSTLCSSKLLGGEPEVLMGGQLWGAREQEVWAGPAAAPLLLAECWAGLALMVFEAV